MKGKENESEANSKNGASESVESQIISIRIQVANHIETAKEKLRTATTFAAYCGVILHLQQAEAGLRLIQEMQVYLENLNKKELTEPKEPH